MAALHLQHLHKRFGATLALDDASLKVERGSIHGLVGENGAGKSTLIKILAGIHKADAGQVSIDGQAYAALSPRQVDALGVQFIHQERLLPASFTVGEALFFGHELRRGPFVDRRRQQREATRLLAEYFDLQLPAGALVSELSSAERQVLQITRALIRQPKILVFDEPSVALVKREVDQLLRIVKRLRDQGLSILYISHYLQEVDSLCDEVTVLRNGRDVAVVLPSVGWARAGWPASRPSRQTIGASSRVNRRRWRGMGGSVGVGLGGVMPTWVPTAESALVPVRPVFPGRHR